MTKALWIACAILSVVGFLLMLTGFIMALALGSSARIQEATTPVAYISTGIAISIIPWCLAASVSQLVNAAESDDSEA